MMLGSKYNKCKRVIEKLFLSSVRTSFLSEKRGVQMSKVSVHTVVAFIVSSAFTALKHCQFPKCHPLVQHQETRCFCGKNKFMTEALLFLLHM